MTIEPGIYPNMSEAEYHGDPWGDDSPSLSASTAKRMIDYSPLHVWHTHPRLGGQRGEQTTPMRLGSALHAMVLYPIADMDQYITAINSDAWRTDDAKAKRAAAVTGGKIPINKTEMERLHEPAKAARALLATTPDPIAEYNEVTLIWTDNGVACRSRLDRVVDTGEELHIYDLKFRACTRPSKLDSTAWSMGDDLQAHAYTTAAAQCWPHYQGRIKFYFAIVERTAPHSTYLAEPTADMVHFGALRWTTAREKWTQCLADNNWPGYGPQPVSVPEWAAAQFAINL